MLKFPQTNRPYDGEKKEAEVIKEAFGQNAHLIEEMAKKIDWKLLTQTYFKILAIVLFTIFSLIVTVRLAYILF